MQIEAGVNSAILSDHKLSIKTKNLDEAIAEGAMALFGEKYGEKVRTVTIDPEKPISYELCGGTHVENTGIIGTFLIISEGSTAAGIRRIEAVTGRGAYEVIRERNTVLRKSSQLLNTGINDIPNKILTMIDTEADLRDKISTMQQKTSLDEFNGKLTQAKDVNGVTLLIAKVTDASIESMRQMTDLFRNKFHTGIVVLGTVSMNKPSLICAVTDDLIQKTGLNAGELVRKAAVVIEGSGGGRPNLAQAGGKNPARIDDALAIIQKAIEEKL
jgi:alanyl-tRNA synthetase